MPQFPVDDWETVTKNGPDKLPQNQNLENWLKTFEKDVLPEIRKGESLCFIGHSLGPLFILHAVDKYNIQLNSAIFIAPFLEKLNKSWQVDLVNKSFYKKDFDFEKLKKLIPKSFVFTLITILMLSESIRLIFLINWVAENINKRWTAYE